MGIIAESALTVGRIILDSAKALWGHWPKLLLRFFIGAVLPVLVNLKNRVPKFALVDKRKNLGTCHFMLTPGRAAGNARSWLRGPRPHQWTGYGTWPILQDAECTPARSPAVPQKCGNP